MQPFIKWAGGKRWLVAELEQWILLDGGKYFEPFLGGGATFFHFQPSSAVLSDANADLIDTYKVVRDFPDEVESGLTAHQGLHCHDHYYLVRNSEPFDAIERACRFLYLNRSCWNGLYRVNLKGKFNVPKGTKTSIIMPGESFQEISKSLSQAEIIHCDFEDTISQAGDGDVVYVDPPYTVKHNYNGFLKYNQRIFSWEDQVRLRNCCFQAQSRGATVIVSNADHESIHDLYADVAIKKSINRSSVIAGKASARQSTTELLLILCGRP